MSIRNFIQSRVIDPLQFRIDCLGREPYQPLPWVSSTDARRSRGTRDRWCAIEAFLREQNLQLHSAMDVGCNIGYFCFALAKIGVPVLGVEMNPRHLRIASYAKRRTEASLVSFVNMKVTPTTARLLPKVDLTLLLAMWHHWVREHGVEAASALLQEIWARTNKVLLFESGEADSSAKYGLPLFEPNPKAWFSNYLAQVCEESEVCWLGEFETSDLAPRNGTFRSYRNLFAAVRRRKGLGGEAVER